VASFLSRTFTGKKYLLVLDDVWSENHEEWEKLRLLLKDGKRGSKIIVTTRCRKVGMMVRTVPPFILKGLSNDDCWELFRCKAFEEGEEDLHPRLVRIGKEIVQKCGGVPLAAKALGSMLRFNKSEQSWMAVKDSQIWQMEKEETILPSLKLSYDQMASDLKQCFAYCSVFPRNHEIDREKLIQQWVSLGFIQPAKYDCQSVFDRANDCFEHLLWMSFLQEVEGYDLSKKEIEEDGNVSIRFITWCMTWHNLLQGMKFRQSIVSKLMVTLKIASMHHCLMTWGFLKLYGACFAKYVPYILGDVILTSSWFFMPGVCESWIYEAVQLSNCPSPLAN
jgi:hypothetical protein